MIKPPFIRSPFNYDRVAASDEAVAPYDPVSLTVQSQKDDADLNILMRRFGVTGHLPQGMRVPEYGDFSGVSDFRSAIEAVRDAEANFMKLEGNVRAMFSNDPQLFLDFCSNPANIGALREMGLTREVSNGSGQEGSGGSAGQARVSSGAAAVPGQEGRAASGVGGDAAGKAGSG